MKQNINHLTILGFIIIIILFYLRFIRERFKGNIDFNFTYLKVFLYLLSLSFFIILLILNIIIPIYLSFNLKKTHRKPNRKTKIKEFISLNFLKLIKKIKDSKFSNMFLKSIEIYKHALEEFGKYFYKSTSEKFPMIWIKMYNIIIFIISNKYFFIFTTIFYFLPPLIIALTYFIESIIFHHIKYFPTIIFLMIFPLILKVILYCAKLYCLDLTEHLSNFYTNNNGKYSWSKNCPLLEEEKNVELITLIIKKIII